MRGWLLPDIDEPDPCDPEEWGVDPDDQHDRARDDRDT